MNPLSLSELKEMEKHLPSRNVKSEEDKVISNEVAVESEPVETKYCEECGNKKPLLEFTLKQGMNRKKIKTESDYKTHCKECRAKVLKPNSKYVPKKSKSTKEYMGESALKIYNECPKWFKKKRITAQEYAKKFDYANSTALQHLNILVERGILESIGRGKKKFYTLVKKDVEPVKKDSYSTITDSLPKSEPKKELPKPMSKLDELIEDTTEHQKTIDELKTAKLQLITANKGIERFKEENEGLNIQIKDLIEHNDTLEHLTSDLQSEIKLLKEDMEVNEAADPITQEDLNNLEQIGIISYPMQKSAPEDRITEVISKAYSGAESIQITPESHEIHIKMKG